VWDLSLTELEAVFAGASKARTWWYELALYTAWHTAAFASQAMAGKLEAWSTYQQKVTGSTPTTAAPAGPVSWEARKAERAAQMALFKKHQQARTTPPRARRG
jgi:hypothetical protein